MTLKRCVGVTAALGEADPSGVSRAQAPARCRGPSGSPPLQPGESLQAERTSGPAPGRPSARSPGLAVGRLGWSPASLPGSCGVLGRPLHLPQAGVGGRGAVKRKPLESAQHRREVAQHLPHVNMGLSPPPTWDEPPGAPSLSFPVPAKR